MHELRYLNYVDIETEPALDMSSAVGGLTLCAELDYENDRVEFGGHRAPTFSSLVQDDSRQNLITYECNRGPDPLTGNISADSFATVTLTEHQSLIGLDVFLQTVERNQKDQDIAEQARSMRENITFVGKPEHNIAAKGIADDWIRRLGENPQLQICAVTGKIDPEEIKSDSYLLDHVLKNFSNEQLKEFQGRLVLDVEDITADPENIDIILLDDWMITGKQLNDVAKELIEDRPEYRNSIKIQLIAASENRLSEGLYVQLAEEQINGEWQSSVTIPVSSYYVAHPAPAKYARFSQAFITGSHSSVDYDFGIEISRMARILSLESPPAVNIVRGYANGSSKMEHIDRLKRTSLTL